MKKPSAPLMERLATWNQPQIRRDWESEDDFVSAFLASEDADDLDDDFSVIEAEARKHYQEIRNG